MRTSPPPGPLPHAWSLRGLADGAKFVRQPWTWVVEQRQRHASAVFRAVVGAPLVFVTDPVAADFIATADTGLLDRSGGMRAGYLQVRRELTGGGDTAALSGGPTHRDLRGFTDAWLALRADALAPAFEAALADHVAAWRRDGAIELLPAVAWLASDAVFRWLLGVPGPGGAQVLHWAESLVTLPLDGVAASLGRAVLPKVSPGAIATTRDLDARVRAAPVWPELVEEAARWRLAPETLAGTIFTTCLVNAAGPLFRGLPPALIALALTPGVRDAARADHAAFDRLQLELLRLFPQPALTFRVAQRDFELPGVEGGWSIRRGEELAVYWPAIHRDPSRFPDPERLDPERFRDASGDTLLGFGARPGAPSGRACVPAGPQAYARMLRGLLALDLALPADVALTPDSRWGFTPDDLRVQLRG